MSFRWILLWLFIVAFATMNGAYSQGTSTSEPLNVKENLFRIGYLSDESGLPLTTTSMNGLREALLRDSDLSAHLHDQGFTGIGLYEADGSADLVPRLIGEEFHLSFCTTRNWVEVSDRYEAFLQTREPDDILNSRTGFALRRGVIFVGPTHPLFSQAAEGASVQSVLEAKDQAPFAVVQSQDLAGYVAPLLWLKDQQPEASAAEQQFLWCRSGEEVVKSVVSGLAPVGACEERELVVTLREWNLEEREKELVRVIARTTPIPANPVLLRNDLNKNTNLRQRLQVVLREFARSGGLQEMQLTASTNADYAEARLLMNRFRESTQLPGSRQ